MKKTAIFLIVLLIGCMPLCAIAMDLKGGASFSYFNQNDDASPLDFSIFRARVNCDISNFYGENKILHLDADSRQSGSTSDFNTGIPDTRLRNVNLEIKQAFSNTDIFIGRQYINQLPGARVDGLHAKYFLKNQTGIGIFAGLQPDPFTDDLGGDFSIAGAYVFHRKDGLGFSGGVATSLFKGKEDSTWLYGQGDYRISPTANAYLSLRADREIKGGSGFRITNLTGSVNQRIGRKGRIGLSYSQSRAIQLAESMNYNPLSNLYRSFRLTASYRLFRSTFLRGSADFRSRDRDSKSASIFMGGIRQTNLLRYFYLDAYYRKVAYFTSNVNQYYGALGAQVFSNFSAEGSFTFSDNKQDDLPNTMEQTSYALNLNWMITRHLYATGRYESAKDTFLSVSPNFSSAVSTNFNRRNIFFLVGYRF